MTYEELKEMLESTGMEVHYNHAPIGTRIPFITYKTSSNNFFADNQVYAHIDNLEVRLYSGKRDLNSERNLEQILKENGFAYNRDETYEDKTFIQIYNMEVLIDGEKEQD